MQALTQAQCDQVVASILSQFGDGSFDEERYIFDAITRVPDSFIEKRLKPKEVIARLSNEQVVYVVFDPHPQNAGHVHELLRYLQLDEDTPGLVLAPADLLPIFEAIDCDFYVVATNGQLLAVGSHEDEGNSLNRSMWCPIPTGATPGKG